MPHSNDIQTRWIVGLDNRVFKVAGTDFAYRLSVLNLISIPDPFTYLFHLGSSLFTVIPISGGHEVAEDCVVGFQWMNLPPFEDGLLKYTEDKLNGIFDRLNIYDHATRIKAGKTVHRAAGHNLDGARKQTRNKRTTDPYLEPIL